MAEDYGIKISLPGYDINKATPEQCSIHSKYDTLKTTRHAVPAHYGNVQLVFNNNPPVGKTLLRTFQHNLGFRPCLMSHFYVHAGGVNYPIGAVISDGIVPFDPFGDNILSAEVNDTDFNLYITRPSDPGLQASIAGLTIDVRYYIFANDGK